MFICRRRIKKGTLSSEVRKRIVEFMTNRSFNKGATRDRKEFIWVRQAGEKVKMQKHYLQYSMKNVWEAYKNEYEHDIAFSVFCRQRPRWIIVFNTRRVDTCACWLCHNHRALQRPLARICKEHGVVLEPVGAQVGHAPIVFGAELPPGATLQREQSFIYAHVCLRVTHDSEPNWRLAESSSKCAVQLCKLLIKAT